MNIENKSEDFKIENQEKVIISSCISNNIIIINCKNVDIYDINSEFVFIDKCSKCSILSSKIDNLFINKDVKLTVHNLEGKVNKYKIISNNNDIVKGFGFHF